ncbi:MAG: class I SAM-dependent methyltransferase [Verrucomicrobia bacterium]|nr:class I SAM-dependent methyltransferase [Verrucomicrobiota bacterium]
MELEEVQHRIRSVNGWLSPMEVRTLYRLARGCTGRGVIVEIGSWQGKSTLCLAGGSQAVNGPKVYAIDPHVGSPEHQMEGKIWTFDAFQKNIADAGLSDRVVPIVKMSGDAVRDMREPIELLFIDGAHEYEAVKADFENYEPWLMEGGVIAFHDTVGWPGPERLVAESIFRSDRFAGATFANSITYARKVARNTASERLANRMRLAVKNLYAAVYVSLLRLKKRISGQSAP